MFNFVRISGGFKNKFVQAPILKLTSERASKPTSERASRRDNMKVKKVNWYDEELHKFYDTKKDNDGFIYGLYGYDGDNIIDVQWFKSEIERDQQASEQKG